MLAMGVQMTWLDLHGYILVRLHEIGSNFPQTCKRGKKCFHCLCRAAHKTDHSWLWNRLGEIFLACVQHLPCHAKRTVFWLLHNLAFIWCNFRRTRHEASQRLKATAQALPPGAAEDVAKNGNFCMKARSLETNTPIHKLSLKGKMKINPVEF